QTHFYLKHIVLEFPFARLHLTVTLTSFIRILERSWEIVQRQADTAKSYSSTVILLEPEFTQLRQFAKPSAVFIIIHFVSRYECKVSFIIFCIGVIVQAIYKIRSGQLRTDV